MEDEDLRRDMSLLIEVGDAILSLERTKSNQLIQLSQDKDDLMNACNAIEQDRLLTRLHRRENDIKLRTELQARLTFWLPQYLARGCYASEEVLRRMMVDARALIH